MLGWAGLGWAAGEHDENDKLVLCCVELGCLRAAGCGMRQLPVGLLLLSPQRGDKHLCGGAGHGCLLSGEGGTTSHHLHCISMSLLVPILVYQCGDGEV